MPRSAGNPNMGSSIDASGSNMGAVHAWFRPAADGAGQKKERAGEKQQARLRVSGLVASVSAAQVEEFFSRFYSTVDSVQLERGRGSAVVQFRFGGERDKALVELQSRELHGCTITLSKARSSPPCSEPSEPSEPSWGAVI